MAIICLISLFSEMDAQPAVEHRQQNRPDTLSLPDRISISTNTIDWLLLVPNLHLEFEIGDKNWNRWSVGLGIRYNWETNHSFKPAQVYNLAEARGELRHYWHTRQIDSVYLPAHGKHNYWGRLVSARRFNPKHLNTTYYRGFFVAASKYSFLLTKDGFQGKALTAGFTYGIIKPLYVFANGNSLDLDMGFSAGLCYTQYDKYYLDRESDCYPVTEKRDWHLLKYPILSEARLAFVYRLGKYPVTRKYRWRYDVDADFREGRDAIAQERKSQKDEKAATIKSMDDLQRAFDSYYNKVYGKCLQEIQTSGKEGKQ